MTSQIGTSGKQAPDHILNRKNSIDVYLQLAGFVTANNQELPA
jgi:hypothetical protein